jgi:hypothetical protein
MEFFESGGCKSCCRIAPVGTGFRTSRDDSLVLSSLADEATFLPRAFISSFCPASEFLAFRLRVSKSKDVEENGIELLLLSGFVVRLDVDDVGGFKLRED